MISRSRGGASRRGATLMLFTLLMPTLLIPLVGLGIDATMCYIVQAKLGSAVDGAALGAGRLLGTQADPAEIAGEFLNANFRTDGTAGFWNANTMTKTIVYTPGITKTIAIDAKVRVPLMFARVFGQPYAIVAAAGTAQRTDTRVMLVIDRSASLSSSTVTAIKNYATSFTQTFTEGTDELGLVVFSGSAIVAYPATRPWSPTICSNCGGPNTTFNDGTNNSMVKQISYIANGGYTATAEALTLAYIEIQKAHMKDLLANGQDGKLNAIVLFTDGAPTSISVYLNDNDRPDNVIKSTSSCTYRNPTAPVASNQKMLGWIAYVGGFSSFGRLSSTDTDSTRSVKDYLQDGTLDYSAPVDTTPETACSASNTITSTSLGSATNTHLARIPAHDIWGNNMRSGQYVHSHYVDASGNTVTPNPIYSGTNFAGDTSAAAADGNNWEMAQWDAADDIAHTIRTDANYPNRSGDTEQLSIAVYCIGYLGSGGLDDGLLKRIANDKGAAGYDATQPTGVYVPASDHAALAQAFANVASQILRLTR